MVNQKGPRETEMEIALAEAHGLLGADAFEAAVTMADLADDLNMEDDHDGAEDALAAARLARDYARSQIEVDIRDGELSADDLKSWERLQKI